MARLRIRVISNEDGLYVSVADLIAVLRASDERLNRDELIANLAVGAAGAADPDE